MKTSDYINSSRRFDMGILPAKLAALFAKKKTGAVALVKKVIKKAPKKKAKK